MDSGQDVISFMKYINPNIFDLPPKTFAISVEDSNYIISNIVEWTISDKPFEDFVKLVQEDTRIYNNLLSFVWCLPRCIATHIHYLVLVVGKLAEQIELNGLLYLICSNYFNKDPFDHYYIDFINKRFGENYMCGGMSSFDMIINRVNDDKKIDINKLPYKTNPADLINYCILTNNIGLYKKFLLYAEPNMSFYLDEYDNKITKTRADININKMVFWTVDFYAVLRQMYDTNVYNDEYNLLNNPLFNPNKDITDNYREFHGTVSIKSNYYLNPSK